MAGTTPNSTNVSRVDRGVVATVYMDLHPEYQYWKSDWQKLRDVIAGSKEIKRKGQEYLRPTKGMDAEDYDLYKDRAVFYNMTAQTLSGMLGQVFRRPPVVRNLPDRFKDDIQVFAKDRSSHVAVTKTAMGEQIGLGRFGILVDAPATPTKRTPRSYAVGYSAENIVDWTIEDIDGFHQPSMVMLREFARDADLYQPSKPLTSAEARALRKSGQMRPPPKSTRMGPGAQSYTTYFRKLVLEANEAGERVYKQYVYKDDPNTAPVSEATPTVRGEPLRFIPFAFFGATSNAADVEKPPILDIADLNLSHYASYAELEWGRMYTGLPVYYAPGTDSEGASQYHIGPSIVWEVPVGSEPGILEFTGKGLGSLEKALNDKEAQIAAIGGRLMPGMSKSVSESNNQTRLREANEQSLLLNVIHAAETGMTWVIRWWLMWRDVPLTDTANLRYEINQDFLTTPIGAREIRAIQMLYQDGIIPIDILYEVFLKSELISSTVTVDEFKAMLDDPNSFINNPDAQARQRGFADRHQELEQARIARDAELLDRKLDISERDVEVREQALATAQKVGSTSVAASRKLGDPEQARPTQAEQAAAATAKKAAETAAKAPAQPVGAPPARRPQDQ